MENSSIIRTRWREQSRNRAQPPVCAWVIGPVTLVVSSRELICVRRSAQLTPKAMKVLLEMIRGAPEAVARTTLLDKVWPNAEINDAIVTDAVRSIRQALKQIGADDQLIVTVPRTGYRLTTVPVPKHRPVFRFGGLKNPIQPVWMAVMAAMLFAMVVGTMIVSASINRQEAGMENMVPENPYYLRGREFYDRYQPEDNLRSIEIYIAGLEQSPGNPLLMSGLAEAYLQQYDAYGLSKDWAEKGYQLAMDALEVDPRLSPVQRAAGLAHAVMGERSAAREHYRQAIEIDPTNRQAIGNLAFQYLLDRDIENAWPLFRRGLEFDTSSPSAAMFIAICYAEAGLPDQAQHWFERAEALGLTPAANRIEFVNFLAWRGETDEALALLEDVAKEMTSRERSDAEIRVRLLDGKAGRKITDFVARERIESFLSTYIADGPAATDRTDLIHEVAVLLFALERFEEGITWLEHAISSGWINSQLTLAEPSVRAALANDPVVMSRLLGQIEINQDVVRRALEASPPNIPDFQRM